ncbi:MAG: hypothetical protein OXR84_09005 [Magnetovibrio sp.]|nr:hypothetical protein [Magnetovibrio sp.]
MQNPLLRSAAALAVAAFIVAGCETPVETQRLPELTFSHLPVFQLDVAAVQIKHAYKAPLKAPHVEHLLPVAPAQALEQWAKDRIKAVGTSGVAVLVIEDARATETQLAKDTSLKGKFTKQQSHRYDMRVRASLELSDRVGNKRASAGANASRSVTVREDVTLNEREKTWFTTVDQMMRDFNREMDSNVRRYMGRWIK